MASKAVAPHRGVAGIGASVLVLTLFLFLALPGRSFADSYREVALSLTQKLVTLFPPAEGYVVSLPAGEIYIDLAEADLMRPGMELVVYREGEDIVHPVTKEVLGKYEVILGYLTVREVQEKYSVCLLQEGGKEVSPGDRVRISSRPLRTLLLFRGEGATLETGPMAQVLQEAANESRRFRLRDEPEWLPVLKEMGLTIDDLLADPASLRLLGGEAKADLLLLVTPPGAEEPDLTLEARSLWTGRTLAEFRQPWTPPAPAASAADSSSPFRLFPGREKVPKREYRRKDLSTAALSIVAGDFTGNGDLEVMITDGLRLTLYRWEEGGLIWRWESGKTRGWQVLHLDAGDLDGDGKEEALVVKVRMGQLVTEALTWDQGEWHPLGRVDGVFLRAVEDGKGQTLLLGQRAGATTVFSGPVRRYRQEGDTFRPDDTMVLPDEVGLFGMGLADTDGDGTDEILTLSDEGRLRVLSQEGEVLSQTRERFGGYPARVTAEELFGKRLVDGGVDQGLFREGIVDETTGKGVDLEIRTAFQGRVLTARDDEGILHVVLPRNFSGPGKVLPDLRKFDKGEVVVLQFVEGRFEEARLSTRQEGFVADAAWGDTDGDGDREILIAVNRPSGALLVSRGSLVSWNYEMGKGLPEKGE